MPTESWSYDLVADLYDDDMGRNLVFDDLSAYRRLLPPAPAPIVEFGCGTGRLSLPLWRDGYSVLALDRSMPMLRVLARKLSQQQRRNRVELGGVPSISLCAADAANAAFRTRFAAALFGYCGFQYLLDEAAIAGFFAAVRRALLPNGVLILDSFIPRQVGFSEDYTLDYQRRLGDGRTLERWKRVRPCSDRVNCVERRYVVDGNESRAINTISYQRHYTPEQLEAALAQHGFRVTQRLFDYGRQGASRQQAQFFTTAAQAC